MKRWRGVTEQHVWWCMGTKVTEKWNLPKVTLRSTAQPHSGVVWRLCPISKYGSRMTLFLKSLFQWLQESSHWFSPNPTKEKLGAILMVAWWCNTGGCMRAGLLAIFKFVVQNTPLSLPGKHKEEEKLSWKHLLPVLFPTSPSPKKALSEWRMRHP